MSKTIDDAAELDAKQRILQAAAHLFAHRGFGSTSVREVVERAGVTKPTLYYWFENKEALYIECVQWKFDEIIPLIHAAVQGEGTVRERLVRFLEHYVAKALEDMDGVRLALTATSPSFEKRPEIDLLSFHTRYFGPLAQLIQEGIDRGDFRKDLDPELAVVMLVGPASMHLRAAIEGFPLKPGFAERTVDLYLNGVAPR